MLSNDFKVRPDKDGDPLQQVAAEILLIEAHAVIPHDIQGARRMLGDLRQQRQGSLVPGPSNRRYNEMHAIHNANLSRLALAKRIGVRPPNAMPPEIPSGGVSEDTLQKAREFWSQLDLDIETFQSTTPEQRRIMKLEAQLAKVIEHSNNLVTACLDYEARIVRLEAIIQGPQAT